MGNNKEYNLENRLKIIEKIEQMIRESKANQQKIKKIMKSLKNLNKNQ